MRYADARSQIRSGDLLAWRGRSIWGRAIGAVTQSAYSHVATAMWHYDRLFIVEAKEGIGTRLEPASVHLPFDYVTTGMEWHDEDTRFVFSHLGKPYNFVDLARVALDMHPDGVGDICSELCKKLIHPTDWLSKKNMPHAPTPANLVTHFLDHGGALKAVKR